jgi:hypothetical protein
MGKSTPVTESTCRTIRHEHLNTMQKRLEPLEKKIEKLTVQITKNDSSTSNIKEWLTSFSEDIKKERSDFKKDLKDEQEKCKRIASGKVGNKIFYTLVTILVLILGSLATMQISASKDIAVIKTTLKLSDIE